MYFLNIFGKLISKEDFERNFKILDVKSLIQKYYLT